MNVRKMAGIVAVATVLLMSGWAMADTHAPWPSDWNNWSDPNLWVTVGNSGNAADSTGYGSVAYTYTIGKFDVTAGQYTAFLNAVAKTDTYSLYNPSMDTANNPYGCNIKRTGSSGSYAYSVDPNWANRPVNFVSWGDAARFCNWLTNGQPTGAQNASTTEDGSYYLNGATSNSALMAVTRKANAKYVIPTENEWYKAAYYDPNKSGGAGYWDYPTGSNSTPSNALVDPDPGNTATFIDANGGHTVGSPYWRTEVGAHENSPSPYGTFDQGGNIWQWNETIIDPNHRSLRGGAFGRIGLGASSRIGNRPASEDDDLGFRVVLSSVHATLPPTSAEQLRSELETALKAKDKNTISSLFNWQGVSEATKSMQIAVVGDMCNHDIAAVKLSPLPAGFQSANESTGVRSNVTLVGMVDVEFAEKGNSVHMPYGTKDGVFYLASPLEEKTGTPTSKAKSLNILVMGSGMPDAGSFTVSYVYVRDGKEIKKDMQGKGNISRAFMGDYIKSCTVQKTSDSLDRIQLIISEDGQAIFESEEVRTKTPIVYEAASPEEEARFLNDAANAFAKHDADALVAMTCWDRVPDKLKKDGKQQYVGAVAGTVADIKLINPDPKHPNLEWKKDEDPRFVDLGIEWKEAGVMYRLNLPVVKQLEITFAPQKFSDGASLTISGAYPVGEKDGKLYLLEPAPVK